MAVSECKYERELARCAELLQPQMPHKGLGLLEVSAMVESLLSRIAELEAKAAAMEELRSMLAKPHVRSIIIDAATNGDNPLVVVQANGWDGHYWNTPPETPMDAATALRELAEKVS